ncbi:hypothetical protein BCCH1_79780 (plasmid) [Burkholderia contaminans]|uniref:Uncharacterized protein n=1 Tax=Burkholderia contaminans TaxID=488447 RepID=A0A286P6K3_9BURK|nr:hypothetical protein BCCH1_79780 [Burkholderia contaminans]
MPIERQAVRIPQRVHVHRMSSLSDEATVRRTDAPGMPVLQFGGLVGRPPMPAKPEIAGMAEWSEEAVSA